MDFCRRFYKNVSGNIKIFLQLDYTFIHLSVLSLKYDIMWWLYMLIFNKTALIE